LPITRTVEGIAANGSIPLVDWTCAVPTDVTSGLDDTYIEDFVSALKSFEKPVFLKWMGEMNLVDKCNAGIFDSPSYPVDYVAAYQRIWDIVHCVAVTTATGNPNSAYTPSQSCTVARNVAFVWGPSIQNDAHPNSNMTLYYPGNQYVDWIGVDGYDRNPTGTEDFSYVFGGWYSAYSSYGKPMMICETGAPSPSAQASFLQGVARSLPTTYPDIKAFLYFDSETKAQDWTLTGAGLTAFQQLASNSYFSVR
jgi:beta-mannanase